MSESRKTLKVIELIRDFEERLSTKTTLPLTRTIMVKKSDFEDILEGIKQLLPEEFLHVQNLYDKISDISEDTNFKAKSALKQAQDTADDIMTEANTKANNIISNAQARAEAMVSNHEIVRQAKAQATKMLENAEKNARYNILNSLEYSKVTLESCESEVVQLLKSLQAESRKVDSEYIAKRGK